MEWSKKTFLVAGTGMSGIGAVKLLDKLGAQIILYDSNEKLIINEIKKKVNGIEDLKIILGKLPKTVLEDADIMILSPGIAQDAEFVNDAREVGLLIWGEVELAYKAAKGKVVAITGTNGKTTTTAIVGEIMKNYYNSTFVVGNIGIPYTSVALDTIEDSITVAEISSFQLETIDEFRPKVSAVLNITPDHLDRHYTMGNYASVKMDITKNQDETDICILNYEDGRLRKAAGDIKANVVFFSSNQKLEKGIYLNNKDIVYNDGTQETYIMNSADMKLVGDHNVENVMAAIGISINMNVPIEIIANTIRNFDAIEHRCEYVAEKNGVIYYNDSKGTNPDASIKSIKAMTRPTILLGGGYDKSGSFDEWIESFGDTVKLLVLLGQTKEMIAKSAKQKGFSNVIVVDTLEEAVRVSAQNAKIGDAVLLSPACASWGMFKNYEERGRMFKEYVNDL